MSDFFRPDVPSNPPEIYTTPFQYWRGSIILFNKKLLFLNINFRVFRGYIGASESVIKIEFLKFSL